MSEDLEALRHLRIARDALLDLAGYPAYHDRASAALQVLEAEDHRLIIVDDKDLLWKAVLYLADPGYRVPEERYLRALPVLQQT